jgi:hypothetical protein
VALGFGDDRGSEGVVGRFLPQVGRPKTARVGADREVVPGQVDGVDSVDDVSCPHFRDPVFRSEGVLNIAPLTLLQRTSTSPIGPLDEAARTIR